MLELQEKLEIINNISDLSVEKLKTMYMKNMDNYSKFIKTLHYFFMNNQDIRMMLNIKYLEIEELVKYGKKIFNFKNNELKLENDILEEIEFYKNHKDNKDYQERLKNNILNFQSKIGINKTSNSPDFFKSIKGLVSFGAKLYIDDIDIYAPFFFASGIDNITCIQFILYFYEKSSENDKALFDLLLEKLSTIELPNSIQSDFKKAKTLLKKKKK